MKPFVRTSQSSRASRNDGRHESFSIPATSHLTQAGAAINAAGVPSGHQLCLIAEPKGVVDVDDGIS